VNTDPVAGSVSSVVAGVAGRAEGAAVAGIADGSDRAGGGVVTGGSEFPDSLDAIERKWKIFALRADVARTVAISIVGTAIAAIFYVFQDNQTQSRYYSDLQAQRESADSALRAQMFTTLFQNYLKAKLESAQRAREGKAGAQELTEAQLTDLQQEIVMSDLLARNFEAVDVRPMFEDIDRRLTLRIDAGREGQEAIADQRKAFSLREQLRRVAGGAAARQTAALISRAGARSEQLNIEQCKTADGPHVEITPSFLPPLGQGAEGFIESVVADSVNVTILHSANARAPATAGVDTPQQQRVRFAVTFYDMPVLESVRLPHGERIALTMTRFLSGRTCERFWGELDEATRADCGPLLADLNDHQRDCSRADISLTTIPAGYIGVRDRPYLKDLTSPASNGGGWLSQLTTTTTK